MTKSAKIILIIVIITILAVLGYILFWPEKPVDNGNVPPDDTGIDTSDWQTYMNEEYGFEVKYPKTWTIVENLDSFIPVFDAENQNIKLGFGIFNNQDMLTLDDWVEKEDFFELKQYEDPESYIAHGLTGQPETLKINDFEAIIYSGGASGGGKFETTLISKDDKVIVIAYSLPPYSSEKNIENKFKSIINSFNLIK